MTVDIGEERTIVAGIGKQYTPEEMVGRRIVVVANLKPAKLMGVESQGNAAWPSSTRKKGCRW